MSDKYYCIRCGAGHEWEKMTSTPEGNLFCPACWSRLDAAREARRKCPVDGAEMEKKLVAGLVLIDRCGTCGGTWFDEGELKVIKEMSKDEGWNRGFFVGWLFG